MMHIIELNYLNTNCITEASRSLGLGSNTCFLSRTKNLKSDVQRASPVSHWTKQFKSMGNLLILVHSHTATERSKIETDPNTRNFWYVTTNLDYAPFQPLSLELNKFRSYIKHNLPLPSSKSFQHRIFSPLTKGEEYPSSWSMGDNWQLTSGGKWKEEGIFWVLIHLRRIFSTMS